MYHGWVGPSVLVPSDEHDQPSKGDHGDLPPRRGRLGRFLKDGWTIKNYYSKK